MKVDGVKTKVTVTVEENLIAWVDQLVANDGFESRSAAIEAAVETLRARQAEAQFEAALAALTPEDLAEDQALAELGMAEWSEVVAGNEW
jgi:Arc/MetJ-type ribon-helix-helix transcriptional regulator